VGLQATANEKDDFLIPEEEVSGFLDQKRAEQELCARRVVEKQAERDVRKANRMRWRTQLATRLGSEPPTSDSDTSSAPSEASQHGEVSQIIVESNADEEPALSPAAPDQVGTIVEHIQTYQAFNFLADSSPLRPPALSQLSVLRSPKASSARSLLGSPGTGLARAAARKDEAKKLFTFKDGVFYNQVGRWLGACLSLIRL
jgi:hypothetical protein